MSAPLRLLACALIASAVGACAADPAAPRRAARVLGPLPGALLAVAGAPDGSLWLAGADAGDGTGAYLARRAPGQGVVERVDLRSVDPVGGDLWWLHVVDAERVLAAGDRGRVLEVARGVPRRLETGTDVQLYGVAVGRDGVAMAVGGSPATLLLWSAGAAPARVALPADVPRDVRLFKVLALPDGRFEVVGERGVHLLVTPREGGPPEVASAPVPGAPRLVTIHGDGVDGAPRVAVGGTVDGYAVEIRDGAFRRIAPAESPPLNGVFVGRRTFAVGFLGAVYERVGDAWRAVGAVDFDFDAHAVWVDADGVAWLAGGHLLDGSMAAGALWRVGPAPTPALVGRDLDASPSDAASDAAAPDTDAERCPALAEATDLELGERDPRGCFRAFAPGGVARVVNGPQGGSHVELSVRLPAASAAGGEAVTRIALEATLVVETAVVARFATGALPVEPDGASAATLVSTDVPVIFAGADPSPWLDRPARLGCTIEAGGRTIEASVEVMLAR